VTKRATVCRIVSSVVRMQMRRRRREVRKKICWNSYLKSRIAWFNRKWRSEE